MKHLVSGLFFLLLIPGLLMATEGTYQIDSQESWLNVIIHPKGIMRSLADSHVLTSRGLAGRIEIPEKGYKKGILQLSIPVSTLEADAAEERKKEKLPGTVSPSGKKKVIRLMNDSAVLDGAKYPRIVVTSERVIGTYPDFTVYVRLRIRHVEKMVAIPVKLKLEGDVITVKGELALLLSDFEIEPYKFWMGLVSTDTEIPIRFKMVARKK